MFDLPDAKRIRRADLNRSRSSSPSSPSENSTSQRNADKDEEARTALLQAKLAALLGPVEFDTPVEQQLNSRDGRESRKAEKEDRAAKERSKRKKRRTEGEDDMDMDIHSDTDHTSNSASDSDTSSPRHPSRSPIPSNQDQDQEQEYDFLLFHSQSNQPSQKIILTTADELSGTGRILRPRPREFYIAPKTTGEKKNGFENIAVSGEDILAEKGRRHWGLEVKWRVRVLKPDGTILTSKGKELAGGKTISKQDANGSTSTPSTQDPTLNTPLVPLAPDQAKPDTLRTKPNKKRRILIREKRRKREAAEQARKREKESKEEAEREKRTRRNREKKVKRRLKEKAKKAEAGDGAGGDGGDATNGEIEADGMSD
ncbi:hypothetical protein DL98DRAFT_538579 [Cadophora sp. DSE1049]|nr:hypothetical protein DL98DRAFT_538579 [Cadophora sp. DSE1049]